jgi:CheY-like chemotaxis protein
MADPDPRRPTILIVDDSSDILEAYAELLRG